MENIVFNGFDELDSAELCEVDGGIGFIAAVVVIGKIAAGTAVVGFVGGCIYEAIMG